MKAYLLIAMLGCLALAANVQGATKPTETLKNLNEAYQDEANAYERYAIFAKKADKEGFPQVARLFRAASRSEQAHRDAHKEAIEKLGGKVPSLTPEKVKVGTTRENLEASLKGETYESVTMYPEFIKKAKEANAEPAVRSFNFARLAEAEHAKLYKDALNHLGKNAKADYYVCPVCGNTETELPAKKCPVCGNPADKWEKID
ncbi:MAG: rubrerythrin family protein [Verrucomicrobia bacterium]|nr:rubrerythrin family protein [Verrucomicrobiota bacterium]